jgi:hypothetical protein
MRWYSPPHARTPDRCPKNFPAEAAFQADRLGAPGYRIAVRRTARPRQILNSAFEIALRRSLDIVPLSYLGQCLIEKVGRQIQFA